MDNLHGSESTWRRNTESSEDALQRCRENAQGRKQFGSHSDLFEERRVDVEIFGHDVQTQEMSVDARTGHGQAIHVLVLICCFPKQSKSLGILTEDTNQRDLVVLVLMSV